jgi:hypothetical protein
MTDLGNLDGTFYNNFQAIMKSYGLPCPETVFGTAATAVANVTALVKCWAVSPTSTLRGLAWNFPTAVKDLGAAKALIQVCETAGGLLAATYVGACIGALILATWETYGGGAIGKLYVLSNELERAYGADMYTVLFRIANQQPALAGSNMTYALMRARAHTNPGPRRGYGTSGSW